MRVEMYGVLKEIQTKVMERRVRNNCDVAANDSKECD